MSKHKSPKQMDPATVQDIRGKVESEGSMDYTFRFYSEFADVKDKKFHKLRKAYVEAAQALADYCRLDEEDEDLDPDYEPEND